MLKLKAATKFKKDLKKFKHDKIIQDKLEDIIELLINEKKLPKIAIMIWLVITMGIENVT